MGHWALVKLAVWILPRGRWRDRLIEHVDNCFSCRARLAGRNEARSGLVQAEDVGRREDFWPRLRQAIGGESAPPERRPSAASPNRRHRSFFWRWAAAAGGIGLAAAIVFFISGDRLRREAGFGFPAGPVADSLRILSARVAGRPAMLYVVDVPKNRMILVWVEPQAEKGERS